MKRDLTIIGGADGPTSIYLAGKISPAMSGVLIVGGVILVIVFIVWVRKRKK